MKVRVPFIRASMAGIAVALLTNFPTGHGAALAAQANAQNPRDLSGVWWAGTRPSRFEFVGGAPELNQAGKARHQQMMAETKTIAESRDLNDVRKCVAVGTPRIWLQPFPFQIFQTPKLTGIVYEHNHVWRLISMDEKQPAEAELAFMGRSVGHWDGDTLVIDNGFFKEGSVLDDTGLPHGPKLHVVERLRKIDAGKTLEVVVTVEDPDFYTKAWTARATFPRRDDTTIMDYVCGFGGFANRYETHYAPADAYQ